MVTEKEYLLLSILSYYNFDKFSDKLELYRYLTSIKIDEHKWLKLRKFSPVQIKIFLEYFKEELEKWKIIAIYDNRAASPGKKKEKTGFYGTVFTNGKDIVISFRGSEIAPYEEAYKDFIENNLLLGINKKPKQFSDATDVFENVIYKYSVDVERISLTGHSLGGGLAQYVAAYSRKTRGYIPKVVTWNAVGIKDKGLFAIEDFLDLGENLKNELSIKSYFNKISKNYEGKWRTKEELLKSLPKDEVTLEKLEKAKLFLSELSDNNIYEEKIFNYGHSKDITFNLYGHIGGAYLIDENFGMKRNGKFLNTLLDKKNFFAQYHYDDVFLPFFINGEERNGEFSSELNMEYITATLRYLFYSEEGFSNEFLALYYSLYDLREDSAEFIKDQILIGLKNAKIFIIYREKINETIKNSNSSQIFELWKETRKRMPSPYIPYDIYDAILY